MLEKIKQFMNETGELRISVNGAKIRYTWLPESVMGAYISIGDTVWINKNFKGSEEYIFGIVCHELHHRWQRKKWGIIRYSLEKLRRNKMETTADEIERKADAWNGMSNLGN